MYSPGSDSWYGKYYRGGDSYQGRWTRSSLLDVDGCFLWDGNQICGRTLGYQIPYQGRSWCSSGRSNALYTFGYGRKVATTCHLLCYRRCLSSFVGNRNLHPSQLDYRIYPKYNDYFASYHSSRFVCLSSDCSLWRTQVYF